MTQLQTKINGPYSDILLRKTMNDGGRQCVWISDTPPATHAGKGSSLALIGRRVASHDVKGREKSLYCHRGSRVAVQIPARNDARESGDTCLGQSGLCLAEGQTCSECGK